MSDAASAFSASFDLTFRPEFRLTERMGRIDVIPAEGSDADSFQALVEEHSAMVFRVAWRMTGNEQDAEDVVQETFLKAHRSFERFDARSSFGTWIYRIAVNNAIDLIRRRRHVPVPRREEEGGPDPLENLASSEPAPDRRAFGGQVERSVASALSLLSEKERAAFVMRHLEGMPIERIAAVLRSRPNAVKQTVFRAVRKLRRVLAPLQGAS